MDYFLFGQNRTLSEISTILFLGLFSTKCSNTKNDKVMWITRDCFIDAGHIENKKKMGGKYISMSFVWIFIFNFFVLMNITLPFIIIIILFF